MEIENFWEPVPTIEYGTVSAVGFFTLEGFPDISYRFEYDEQGQAILEEEYFDKNQHEFEKIRRLTKNSTKYKEIQKLLTNHVKNDQQSEF